MSYQPRLKSPICPTVVQHPPDFVTIRAPVYAIAKQRYMLMIISFGHKDTDVSKQRLVTAIAMQRYMNRNVNTPLNMCYWTSQLTVDRKYSCDLINSSFHLVLFSFIRLREFALMYFGQLSISQCNQRHASNCILTPCQSQRLSSSAVTTTSTRSIVGCVCY